MASSGTARFKVVLTGQFGVGKTSIFERFAGKAPVECNSPVTCTSAAYGLQRLQSCPLPLDQHCRCFKSSTSGRAIELDLWDTAGMERFDSLSGNYYAGASAALVVYSVDSEKSFQTAVDYVVDAIEAAARSTSTGLIVFLCGNKSDVELERRQIDDEMARRLMFQYEQTICQTFVVSSRTGDGVDDMFDTIADMLATRRAEKLARVRQTFDKVHLKEERNMLEPETGCACRT